MINRNLAQSKIIQNEKNLLDQNREYANLNQEYLIQNKNLSLAKEKAEESEQLKTAFLQNISHEIRTPLNAILGFSEMLDDYGLSSEKRKHFTSIIKNSSNQLLAVVSETLTISSLEKKLEKLNIERLSLNVMFKQLESYFTAQAINKKIEIKTKLGLPDNLAEIECDKTKLTQILSNLIANAVKFTNEGFVEFGYVLKESELELYVTDTGIGIKPDVQQIIFERFRQADSSISREFGGAGLGLSISKGYIELLGGKIWVDSEVGKGSTFYFTIPYNLAKVEEEQATDLEQNDDKNTIHSQAIKTILVAEDEEYNYIYIEEILYGLGYNLIHSYDGKEAVDICSSNPNINLVLMDIKMPNMDGQTAAKLIKLSRPDLPIIAQTAYALESEIRKYYGSGFDDYITKPIKKDVLLQKIVQYTKEKKDFDDGEKAV